MKKLITYFVLLLLMLQYQVTMSQKLEMLHIERLNEHTAPIPAQCSPDDIIVTINSSIPNLDFESNARKDSEFKIIQDLDLNQYIICHPREKFLLTVSGQSLEAQDIEIFELNVIHAYRITANILRGTATFMTDPGNAVIYFPELSINKSSGESVTINSGKYKVNILKAGYMSIDTIVTIPSNDTVLFDFKLKPTFSSLKLGIETEDNSSFEEAPIMWIDDKRISLDALIKPDRYRSFYTGVEYHSLYENDIIPFEPGNYRIKIEAKNYVPFETFVNLEEAKTLKLDVMLDLIYGYITFIDNGENAFGATVYINDIPKGEIPLFKTRARVGKNIVRIEKKGFMTEKPSYEVNVFENSEQDFYVNMRVSSAITINSNPISALVFLNNESIGFTPVTISIPSGNHELILKRPKYATEKMTINTNHDFTQKDSIMLQLKSVSPLTIESENNKQKLHIEGLNDLSTILLDSLYKLPVNLELPFGNYYVSTRDSKAKTYGGVLKHYPRRSETVKLPSYSRTSFTTLSFDYTDKDDYEASFGSIHIFSKSGLSTSIANASIMNIDHNGKTYKTFLPYVFFTNWDWRIGGSLTRFLDVNLLGRFKWTPGLDLFKKQIDGMYDASVLMYFYGFEASTRISIFNFYARVGTQIYDGNIFIPEDELIAGQSRKLKVSDTSPHFSFGIRLNASVGKSNNMLRLWYKPLSNSITDLIRENSFKDK